MALTMDDTSFARYYKKIGREEGRLEGKKEGKVEGKKETALKLLEMGISMDVIEKATGLEKEEIEKLNKG
ncbi:hypothetical protein J6TS2_25360 [Heyndrickxia sporothermodurans]|nr:hypothetical protein J6TS2_25360 [Heyndrickxia sporothermodurans]